MFPRSPLPRLDGLGTATTRRRACSAKSSRGEPCRGVAADGYVMKTSQQDRPVVGRPPAPPPTSASMRLVAGRARGIKREEADLHTDQEITFLCTYIVSPRHRLSCRLSLCLGAWTVRIRRLFALHARTNTTTQDAALVLDQWSPCLGPPDGSQVRKQHQRPPPSTRVTRRV